MNNRRYRFDIVTPFESLVISLLSRFLYDWVRSHKDLVKKGLRDAGFLSLAYFMSVAISMFVSFFFLDFPLDGLAPWSVNFPMPLSSYFVMGFLGLMFLTLISLKVRRQ